MIGEKAGWKLGLSREDGDMGSLSGRGESLVGMSNECSGCWDGEIIR